jgi:NADPH:quinone reductase-like Zn-dependent oxidoreductase
MKAAVTTAYGPPEVVELRDLPHPEPGAGELVVRVHASPVTAGDARIRGLDVPRGFGPLLRLALGIRRPRSQVQGWAFAGVVDAVGEGVAAFAVHQQVLGITGLKGGAHAEYVRIPAKGLVLPMPAGMAMETAAALPFGGLTAADFLIDKAQVKAGETVLVNGATGSVGSAALQLARYLGAIPTAVASTEHLELAIQLGADRAIDYRKEPVTGTFDVILDVAGTLPYRRSGALLADGGRLCPVTATLAETVGAALRPRRGRHRITGGTVAESREAFERLLRIHADGGFEPLIGTLLPLSDIRSAHALASGRHKVGNVLVLPASESP